MNEEHELASWYESAEREDVTDDLTVTHVHTTDGTVTLGRDWLAVNGTEAEWEPVIEVLYDSAETIVPLTVPVDTAVSALVDAGLGRGWTDTARRRARGLLAYLHAEGALGLEEGAVVIDPPHDLISSDHELNSSECRFLLTYATLLELMSTHLSERLEEYENKIADIEQGLTDEPDPLLPLIKSFIKDIGDILEKNEKIMFSHDTDADEIDADDILNSYKPAEEIVDLEEPDLGAEPAVREEEPSNAGEEDTTGKTSSASNENRYHLETDLLNWRLGLERLKTVEEQLTRGAADIRRSAILGDPTMPEIDIPDHVFKDIDPEEVSEAYNKGISSEAETSGVEPEEVEEVGPTSAPPANPDTDETED